MIGFGVGSLASGMVNVADELEPPELALLAVVDVDEADAAGEPPAPALVVDCCAALELELELELLPLAVELDELLPQAARRALKAPAVTANPPARPRNRLRDIRSRSNGDGSLVEWAFSVGAMRQSLLH